MSQPLDPNLLQQIKEMLRRDLKLGPAAIIADDMPLFGGDLDLDSLDILLLVTNIEKQLGVRIPNESIGREIFQNVSTLARFVQEHRGKSSNKPGVVMISNDRWLDQLPHREPFRFVSRIVSVEPEKSAVGIWSLTGNEDFFVGHFPGNPIVPGMLIAEALAQISGFTGPSHAAPEGKLAHVDIRFEKSVSPPVEIELHSTFLRMIHALQMCEVQAKVGETIIAQGTLTLHRTISK